MSTPKTNPTTAVEAVPQLVQLLSDLPTGERQKALSAAMILLGDSLPEPSTPGGRSGPTPLSTSIDGVSPKAASWMARSGLSQEQLEHVFSIEADSVDVIAAKMPGSSKRQQTVQSYLICGLGSFLRTGETSFADKDARELCQKIGCYDNANHSNAMKALGNSVHGSKEAGWKLTAPGLTEAAKIVKELSPSTND